LEKIIAFLQKINENVGKTFAWCTSFLVWLLFALVVMRYGFDSFSQKLSELTTYFFALSFLFAGGYAFLHDKHVRVDLFYSNWSEKRKALVNLIGGVFFLLPWCIVCSIVCWKYAYNSFRIGEVSDQPSGLPAVYLLKFALFFAFVFLLIQAIASILKSIQTLRSTSNSTTKIEKN